MAYNEILAAPIRAAPGTQEERGGEQLPQCHEASFALDGIALVPSAASGIAVSKQGPRGCRRGWR
jgi:hypothetical protein